MQIASYILLILLDEVFFFSWVNKTRTHQKADVGTVTEGGMDVCSSLRGE